MIKVYLPNILHLIGNFNKRGISSAIYQFEFINLIINR